MKISIKIKNNGIINSGFLQFNTTSSYLTIVSLTPITIIETSITLVKVPKIVIIKYLFKFILTMDIATLTTKNGKVALANIKK